MFLKEFKN